MSRIDIIGQNGNTGEHYLGWVSDYADSEGNLVIHEATADTVARVKIILRSLGLRLDCEEYENNTLKGKICTI